MVVRGNVAVLRCTLPATHRYSLTWLKEEPLLGRSALHPGGRISLTSTGALHIRDTTIEDSYAKYFCQATHKITSQRRISQPGKVIVTGTLIHL